MVALSSAKHLLQAARPAQPSLPAAAPQCHYPTRPATLRKLCANFTEPCIELLVASTSSGVPCCILPSPNRTLLSLFSLEGLNEETVVDRLAAVEGHVVNTCADCPSLDMQQQPQPSPLVYSPEFGCFLERCLELAQVQKQLGLAPTVLLLQIVSRMDYAADESLRGNFCRYYLHLQVELEAAVKLHLEAITPQVTLAVFEAWARMGALPMHSRSFGLAMRENLKTGRFTPQELSRLLATMATLRAARPSYRPCQYDIANICGLLLSSNLRKLAASDLASVAASLGAFPWPVYQCVLPLLERVAEEGVRRQAVGEMNPLAGAALLDSAVASATKLTPRLGAELEAKLGGWEDQAHLATGNILGFAHTNSAAADELPAFLH